MLKFDAPQCNDCTRIPVCKFVDEYKKAAEQSMYTDAKGPFTISVVCVYYDKSPKIGTNGIAYR